MHFARSWIAPFGFSAFGGAADDDAIAAAALLPAPARFTVGTGAGAAVVGAVVAAPAETVGNFGVGIWVETLPPGSVGCVGDSGPCACTTPAPRSAAKIVAKSGRRMASRLPRTHGCQNCPV